MGSTVPAVDRFCYFVAVGCRLRETSSIAGGCVANCASIASAEYRWISECDFEWYVGYASIAYACDVWGD